MKSIGNICSNNSLAVDRWRRHNLPVSSILTSILSNCMNVSARRNFSAAERRSKMSKVCYFNTAWLSHSDYRDWLERVSIHKARCHVCKKVVDISNMGESALKSCQGNQTRALDAADGGRFPFANYRIFWIGEHIGTSRYRHGYLFMK